jgi:hypothetical protein
VRLPLFTQGSRERGLRHKIFPHGRNRYCLKLGPESGAEVGNQRGRDAPLALEKVFGRVQSARSKACSGISLSFARLCSLAH